MKSNIINISLFKSRNYADTIVWILIFQNSNLFEFTNSLIERERERERERKLKKKHRIASSMLVTS